MITVSVNGKSYSVNAGQELGVFLRALKTSEASGDTSDAASYEAAGVRFPCGGHGKCGKCVVKASGMLSPVTEAEKRFLSENDLAAGLRLACQTRAEGDCEILTAEATPFGSGNVAISGIMTEFELAPGFSRYGAAVDIGTTTIAAKLYDRDGNELASAGVQNPQYIWGADVISRMEAAISGHASELARAVRDAVNALISRLAAAAGIAESEIDGLVITGNTVMLYLLCGIDTEPLTHAPFIAKELFGMETLPSFAGITAVSPDAKLYLPPCISAFVGADITCAALAAGLDRPGDVEILTDIGTNGEMILRGRNGLFACSTAAGPAFEGAGISMGMGGTDGAIDRVKPGLDGGLTVHVIGSENGAEEKGICGSGIVDAVACLLELEAVDETGFMEDDPYLIGGRVTLTQKDIRAVQLAKSAISAGLSTLMKAAGETESGVRRLVVAGGFGNYLDIKNAGKIGLIPQGLVSKVLAAGNAALSGASMLLLSVPQRVRAPEFSRSVKTVELSTDPFFSDEFMNRMLFGL